MTRTTMIVCTGLALALAALGTVAAAQTRCGAELKPAGRVIEVYVDAVATYTCDGGLGEQVEKARILGLEAMERPDGLFFLPKINVVVDSLDVAVSKDSTTSIGCQDIAAADRGAAATGMGHGGCGN